jgi:hypothetical protein
MRKRVREGEKSRWFLMLSLERFSFCMVFLRSNNTV